MDMVFSSSMDHHMLLREVKRKRDGSMSICVGVESITFFKDDFH